MQRALPCCTGAWWQGAGGSSRGVGGWRGVENIHVVDAQALQALVQACRAEKVAAARLQGPGRCPNRLLEMINSSR